MKHINETPARKTQLLTQPGIMPCKNVHPLEPRLGNNVPHPDRNLLNLQAQLPVPSKFSTPQAVESGIN